MLVNLQADETKIENKNSNNTSGALSHDTYQHLMSRISRVHRGVVPK